jgi:hypothetical protein
LIELSYKIMCLAKCGNKYIFIGISLGSMKYDMNMYFENVNLCGSNSSKKYASKMEYRHVSE